MQGRTLLRVVVVMVAGVAALGVAGCGNDEEPALTTIETVPTPEEETGALGEEEFTTQADDICAEAYTALANLPDDSGTQRASIVSGMENSLESLGPPPSNRSDFQEFLDALDDAAAAYENGDTVAGDTAMTTARSAAAEYGLEDCGEEGQELEGAAGGTEAPTTTTPTTTTAPPATTTTSPSAPSGGTGSGGGGGGAGGGGASGGISP